MSSVLRTDRLLLRLPCLLGKVVPVEPVPESRETLDGPRVLLVVFVVIYVHGDEGAVVATR